MKVSSFHYPVSGLKPSMILLGLACCSLFLVRSASAQEDDYGTWRKAEVITRPAAKSRPRPVRIKAPLLTMRWQFFVAGEETSEEAVDPAKRTFVDGELVRIAVQVNQSGYIYVINHTVKRDNSIEGPFLISRGQYQIKKDQQLVLPPLCPQSNRIESKCWWRTKSPPGREVITIIFSRDEIEEWKDLDADKEDSPVSESVIYAISRESPETNRKILKGTQSQGSKGEYVTEVWNPNPRRNEVLVERIEFTHK
jgi:uncharacterized protein DUF4384